MAPSRPITAQLSTFASISAPFPEMDTHLLASLLPIVSQFEQDFKIP
jgi:hypothetical protein